MTTLDFPKNILEFQARFSTEDACREYLARSRWGHGYRCLRCDSDARPYYLAPRHLMQCRTCGYQVSSTAGSVMHRTKMPLRLWFWAAYLVSTHTPGFSALQFARQVGIRNYETAFLMLHKLRAAMVRVGRDKLSGLVEADETYVGGHRLGPGGRGALGKAVVVGAVEVRGDRAGKLRLRVVPDASSASLVTFLRENVDPGTIVRTDGWKGYSGLEEAGFRHDVVVSETPAAAAETDFPHVHRVFSNLKAWLIGTHHGVSPWHLQAYLNEFVFRFNRRRQPMAAFRSVLGLVDERDAPTYEGLYGVRRKEAGSYVHPNPPRKRGVRRKG